VTPTTTPREGAAAYGSRIFLVVSLWLLTALLAFGPRAFGQTSSTPATPVTAEPVTPAPLIFTVTTEATMWRGAGQAEAGTDAIGSLEITPRWSARTDNIVLPGPGISIDTIGAQGCDVPKTSPFQFCGNGGFGAVTSPAPTHYAFNLGTHLNYDVNGNKTFSFKVFDVQYIHGGITDGGESTNNSVSFSIGLNISIP
jgi:hypothetical protein